MADVADKRTGIIVGPLVARQLVGKAEAPVAVVNIADKRFFPRVPAPVVHQMRHTLENKRAAYVQHHRYWLFN